MFSGIQGGGCHVTKHIVFYNIIVVYNDTLQ